MAMNTVKNVGPFYSIMLGDVVQLVHDNLALSYSQGSIVFSPVDLDFPRVGNSVEIFIIGFNENISFEGAYDMIAYFTLILTSRNKETSEFKVSLSTNGINLSNKIFNLTQEVEALNGDLCMYIAGGWDARKRQLVSMI